MTPTARLIAGLLITIACASTPPEVSAQNEILLKNDRIRLEYATGETQLGTLAGIVADTLYLAEGYEIETRGVRELHVSLGRHNWAGQGALYGGIIGMVAGLGLGLALGGGEDGTSASDVIPEVVAFGFGGTMFGFWLGMSTTREDWVSVPRQEWTSTPPPR